MACHLIDWAAAAAPQEARVHEARARIYAARAAQSSSTSELPDFQRRRSGVSR